MLIHHLVGGLNGNTEKESTLLDPASAGLGTITCEWRIFILSGGMILIKWVAL